MNATYPKLLCAATALVLAAYGFGAATNAPGFSERGKLLFSDDFNGSALDAGWAGKLGKWEVANGWVRGSEQAEDHHAAVRRHPLTYHDAIFEFAFQFDGGKAVHLSLNNKGGHVCRLILTPKGMALMADKPNVKSDLKPERLAAVDTAIASGVWHRVAVEVHGAQMIAQLDGKESISGSSARVDVDKADFGFPVQGASVMIDYVRVYERK
jgi:hypothetical protein